MGNEFDALPPWRKAANISLHASLAIKQDLEDALQEEVDLLLADTEALLHLEHGDLRMSEIADRLVLSRGGTTKVIDRLEAMGYVARSPDPEDRRATVVAISDAGREIRRRAREVTERELLRTWGNQLSDAEAETIIGVMQRLLEARKA